MIHGAMTMTLIHATITIALTGQSAAAQAPRASLDLEPLRGLGVQHDGRWPPLDTVARDVVESVTGHEAFQDRDPLLWLLNWTFDPESSRNQPLITIRNAELRSELQLPADRTVFSFDELVKHERLRALINDLGKIEKGRKPDPLEKKVSDINARLITLQRVFSGQLIRPIPNVGDFAGAWTPVSGASHADHPGHAEHADAGSDAVSRSWASLHDAFLADDTSRFATAAHELTAALSALPAAYRPAPKRIQTELRYNALRPFNTAWKVMWIGAVLAAVALFVRRRWFDVLAVTGLALGFAILTWGLSMRWQIAGRIPASNMYESLLFLSWGMGAFAILSMLVMRDRIVPLTASAMGALSLMLADSLPLDYFVRPIAPVLMDTVWMSIHVPVIMVSYSVLALAVLIAHVQLIVRAAAPHRIQWTRSIDGLHYWYVHVGSILLLAGIVTGSMWAASSWGRYWGWDPKEVWSLVALLAYLTILHVRIDRERIPPWGYAVGAIFVLALLLLVVPKLAPITGTKALAVLGTVAAIVFFLLARGEFATAVKSILAFWMIIMTYVGVNYVLGIGLHSYGFGTGAVVRYMFLLGGGDLLLVALCSVVFLARRSGTVAPASAVPLASPA